MMEAYRVMLTYIKSAVTRNYSEKCINDIMDFISGSASQNFELLQEFYQTTLKALEEAKNERLRFKTNLKLCKIWFDMGEYGRMNKVSRNINLVYGGGSIGLMGLISQVVHDGGRHVIGVIPKTLMPREVYLLGQESLRPHLLLIGTEDYPFPHLVVVVEVEFLKDPRFISN